MDKFKDIQAGDIVYTRVEIVGNWNHTRLFWVPKPVARVTPKRFVIDNKQYRKSDGKTTGDLYFNNACHLGDVFNGGRICDESEAMRRFIQRIKMIEKGNKIMDKLKDISPDHLKFDEIYGHIQEIEKLFQPK